MRELRIDCRQLTDRTAAHTYLQKVLPLPGYYGRNLDALYDCLTELPETVLVLEHRREVTPYGEAVARTAEDAAQASPALLIAYDEDPEEG